MKAVVNRISEDLRESKISWKVAVSFIPIAFFTYLFHESGHWIFGEITGNRMVIGLNSAEPESGYFINNSHALWSAIGGPAFTILQAMIFMLLTMKTRSVYTFSLVFFAGFLRFFSIFFGGYTLQDEAGISRLSDINMYVPAIIVLSALFMLVWISSRAMKFDFKAIGYYTTLSTLATLLVIGVNRLIY